MKKHSPGSVQGGTQLMGLGSLCVCVATGRLFIFQGLPCMYHSADMQKTV